LHKLGKEQEYSLSENALNHILNGDIGERLYDIDGKRNAGKLQILKGGLHTVDGWKNFRTLHPKLKHLHQFDSAQHKYWYYARELQNGVICLKIPKEVFQSKAAKMTMFPDEYYKSGYLWKTLFPEHLSSENIISLIDEALNNLDKEESTENQLIGYALCADPMTAMRIVIQVRGKDIQSAFPAWTQPSTGNNGKPYTHSDSIGFNIAASTVYFDDDRTNQLVKSSTIFNHDVGLDSILYRTPKVFLCRECPKNDEDRIIWKNQRQHYLMEYAGGISDTDLRTIYRYLTDIAITKFNYEMMVASYSDNFEVIESDMRVKNAFSFTQNIIDSLDILFFSDQFRALNNFPLAVAKLLKNQFTTTGGLDSFNKKRIHRRIMEHVIIHHNKDTISSYVELLAESPVKKELYQEFNLNSYFKKSLDLSSEEHLTKLSFINLPNLSFPLEKEHLEGYIINQLSMNYHVHFDHEQKREVVEHIIQGLGKNYDSMISDNLVYANCNEFQFLCGDFAELLVKIIEKLLMINDDALGKIIRDYSRIQYSQRLNLAFIFSEEFKYDIDYGNVDEFYRKQMIAKHERVWLTTNLDIFLDKSLEYSKFVKNDKFENEIESFKKVITTEQPPFLNEIPSYINSWQNNHISESQNLKTIVS
jgi:hypothetical protein